QAERQLRIQEPIDRRWTRASRSASAPPAGLHPRKRRKPKVKNQKRTYAEARSLSTVTSELRLPTFLESHVPQDVPLPHHRHAQLPGGLVELVVRALVVVL